MKKVTMNDYIKGITDAGADLSSGWLPDNFTLDSVVNQLRVMIGATDSYIAGYLSVIYSK